MKITVIYYSLSGKTRTIAERIHADCIGDIIEVVPDHPYSTLSAVTKGCYRALTGAADLIVPGVINVGDTDLVVLATPVWAGKPTPVINAAIRSLTGQEEKKAFLVVTCSDTKSGGQAISLLRTRVSERGLEVIGEAVLDKKAVISEGSIGGLIKKLRSAEGGV